MEKYYFSTSGFAGLALAVALVVVSFVGAGAYADGKHADDTISVTGAAERIVQSDVVKWSASLGLSMNVAGYREGSRLLTSQSKAVEDYLISKGVSQNQIAWSAPNINPSCQSIDAYSASSKTGDPACNGGLLVGYSFQRSFTVESKDVDAVSALAQNATSDLMEKGISLASNNPEYYVATLPQLKLDMLDEATKNAKERADRIVKATGAQLGQLRSAGMGVFQVTAVNSTEISDYGAYDTMTREKKITSIVRTTFDVK